MVGQGLHAPDLPNRRHGAHTPMSPIASAPGKVAYEFAGMDFCGGQRCCCAGRRGGRLRIGLLGRRRRRSRRGKCCLCRDHIRFPYGQGRISCGRRRLQTWPKRHSGQIPLAFLRPVAGGMGRVRHGHPYRPGHTDTQLGPQRPPRSRPAPVRRRAATSSAAACQPRATKRRVWPRNWAKPCRLSVTTDRVPVPILQRPTGAPAAKPALTIRIQRP